MAMQKKPRQPLTLKSVFRDQALIGRLLMWLAIFLILPVDKPSLWILEGWGGLRIHSWAWGVLFMAVGFLLTRCRRLAFAYAGVVIAAGLLATICIGGLLTTGLNFGSVLAFGLFIQCGQTARDYASIMKGAERKRRQARNGATDL